MSSKKKILYQGKAKKIIKGPDKHTLIQFFKDDATAFNKKKHKIFRGKGILNNLISAFIMTYLKRAKETLKIILDKTNLNNKKIVQAWELNERHYGNLTGLNKDEMKKKLSDQKIHELRRSWDTPPEKLDKNSPYHPLNIEIYNNLSKDLIPDTESLKDTYERVIPYFKRVISKDLKNNVLISAHGNSIRALCKYLLIAALASSP